tara:strand:+ start:80103 stop:80342 length:240 start_codon:yes stop_codon:yes gene_type:complete
MTDVTFLVTAVRSGQTAVMFLEARVCFLVTATSFERTAVCFLLARVGYLVAAVNSEAAAVGGLVTMRWKMCEDTHKDGM